MPTITLDNQQTAATRQRMREQFERTESERKAAGQEEAARNQAIRNARDKALAEGLAAVAEPALAAGVVVEREGKALVAKHGGAMRGQWWPDKRPAVRGQSIPVCSASEWIARLLR